MAVACQKKVFMKNKKPLFSKKGNPEDYDYLSHQVLFIAAAAILILLMVIFVE